MSSAETNFLSCVEKLNACVHEIKNITRKLEEIVPRDITEGLLDIEEGIAKIEHTLEVEVERCGVT